MCASFPSLQVLEEEAQTGLIQDGESVYGQTKDLPFLYLAHLVLLKCGDFLKSLQVTVVISSILYLSRKAHKANIAHAQCFPQLFSIIILVSFCPSHSVMQSQICVSVVLLPVDFKVNLHVSQPILCCLWISVMIILKHISQWIKP